MEQIDTYIKRGVAKELHRYFPDLFISVTQVHVTKDLEYAKIWITSPIDSKLALKESKNKAKEIRMEIAKDFTARKVPRLSFVEDITADNAFLIENLIKQIKEESKE